MSIRSPKWLVIAALVCMAPDTPGVLELWDDDELLLVRATRNKHATLRSELARELEAHSSEATHFSWEITYRAEARERELLAEYEHEHHRRPRLNS